MPLTDTAIRNAKPLDKPYKLSDAQGLYLLIKPNGSKLWQLKYRFGGKEKKLAFGAYPTVTLANARKLREEARAVLSAGDDPGVKKQQEKQAKKSGNTFEEIARKWLAGNIRWNEAHAAKVLRSLELHVFPLIGKFPVADLKTADLLIPLRVAERKGNLETAARIQQRTTAIMRYAVQESLIASNPANDLTGAIAPPPKNHYPALPLEKIPELLEKLESYSGRLLTRLAVQLNLLIFIRSSELRFARWTEIDLDGAMWIIPAEREPIPDVRYSERGAKMKMQHLVPLSKQAVAVLKQLKLLSGSSELLFPGDHDPRKPMSENTINKALRVMGYDTKVDVCGHGFRTMACSALIESGRWSKDAVERQMSHQERNNVRAAYIHKAEHLDERTQMMQWWSDWLDASRQKFVAPYRYNRQVQVA
ncbi:MULTISPECIES: tyrosine-type recombinase/integrase [unclassified Klebsiella]|uniref:tyrosine-type recombinase/integrase n=1 Tax=Enterobacteriaceae TaxID=543 RepID=UPI0015DC5BC3|nr:MULTISPECIES: integrase arm-type DNA-binding domain-containing protein [unclassified Klebsiella]HAT3953220.1 integrase arm-type DNA-binding domain-containing protein [Kluyvera ascorbata]BBR60904.1 integrase [Klebsiella sp. WP4-W18-ESBL-05]BBS93599.1 integrase [Klebsiella sp. WP7-S18-CRE-02]BBS98628.1 integrase [Klebsiella sp. WP7-S18-CRE-03]BBT03695.1 integrase [Klebsiella sp. WP7-S18-ESBL-04]